MSTGFAFKQSLQLCNVSNLRIFWFFSYGLLKLAFRARKCSGTFEKRAPGKQLEYTVILECSMNNLDFKKMFC